MMEGLLRLLKVCCTRTQKFVARKPLSYMAVDVIESLIHDRCQLFILLSSSSSSASFCHVAINKDLDLDR